MSGTRSSSDSINRARWIDNVCDDFEAEWLAGKSPKVEDYLARVAENDRAALALELIPLERHHRQQRSKGGELPMTLGSRTRSSGNVARNAGGGEQPVESVAADLGNLGTYEILQEIARGGMGIVFKGRDADLRRDIAVKVLLENHRNEIELVKRFIEEAQIAGQLQHPGVTPVYALGEFPDGRPYFTMKLVKGETLSSLLAARPNPQMDRERFLKIFEQICQTLAYAHSRGVIHRDLKPSNIMVGAFGEVQVMDWGLAKVLAEGVTPHTPLTDVSLIRTARSGGPNDATASGSQTQFGSVLGTLAYMPPEQALGEVAHLDQRADVFGLGAILCEILTGRPPYVAPDFEQLRRKAVRGNLAEAIESLDRCGADSELISLARRTLAAEPADRPADAGVLARELVAYREGVESRLRQAELAQAQAITRAIEERSRRKLTLVFSGALLTALAIGVIGTTWGLVKAGYALHAEAQERSKAQTSAQAAHAATAAENEAKEKLRRDLFAADLQLANQMWESDNGAAKNVAALLAGCIPAKGQTDLREFTWRLQWTALNRNSLVLKSHARGARLAAFLPDGGLATVDGEQTLRRWILPEEAISSELTLPKAAHASCGAISGDGLRVALGSGNEVIAFDTPTGRPLHTFSGEALALALSFSADGRRLAGLWSDGRVQIWDVGARTESASLFVQRPGEIWALERIHLAPDGQSLFLLDYPESNQVTCLTVGSAASESLCPARHRSYINSIAISPDGKWRATGDANGQVCLASMTDDTQSAMLRVHRGSVWALGFSADGGRLAAGGADGTVTIWDVGLRERLASYKGHAERVDTVSFSPDGLTLASGSADGSARVWNLRSDRTSRVLGEHELPVFSVAYSPDGRHVAVGTGSDTDMPGGFVKIWDAKTGENVTSFRAAEGRVLALAFSRDGSRLITGGFDSHLRVWNTQTGSELGAIECLVSGSTRKSVVGTLAISPDGDLVVAGFGHPTFHQPDYEQVAKVWKLSVGWANATPVGALNGHSNTICDVAFSRDGRLLATASDDHQVILRSVADWKIIVQTLSGTERFKSVAFSRDGKWVLAGGASGAITIWETVSGRLVKKLRGHSDAVQRIAFSPDGRTLASASWDNTIRLWDPVSGRETRTLQDHADWISCLAFAPNGNTLATGSFDAQLRLWEAASEHEISNSVANDLAEAVRRESQLRDQRRERKTRKALPLSAALLNSFAGSYDRELVVKRNAENLLLSGLPGEKSLPITFCPTSATEFFCRDREIDIHFLKDNAGQVVSVVIYQDGQALEAKKQPAGE